MSLCGRTTACVLAALPLFTSGCVRQRPETLEPRELTEFDKELAEEAIRFIEQAAAEQKVVNRYGKLNSIKMKALAWGQSLSIGDIHPTRILLMICTAEFDRLTVDIPVGFSNTLPSGIHLTPSYEFETKEDSPLADCQLKTYGGELWFVRNGGNMMRVKCDISACYNHPDFRL